MTTDYVPGYDSGTRNRVTNGSFELGGGTLGAGSTSPDLHWIPYGWEFYSTKATLYPHLGTTSMRSSDDVGFGKHGTWQFIFGDTSADTAALTTADYQTLTQTVDLTDVTSLTFRAATGGGGFTARFSCLINGSEVWGQNGTSAEATQTIDVSSYNGSCTLQFKMQINSSATANIPHFVIDRVCALVSVGGFSWCRNLLKGASLVSLAVIDVSGADITSSVDEDFLYDDIPAKPMVAPSGKVVLGISIEFSTVEMIDFVALINHNLASGCSMEIKGNNTAMYSGVPVAGGWAGTSLGSVAWRKNEMVFIASTVAQEYRYIGVIVNDDISSAQTADLQIGQLIIGLSARPGGKVEGPLGVTHQRIVDQIETEAGVVHSYIKGDIRTFDLRFSQTKAALATGIAGAVDEIGGEELVCFVIDSSDVTSKNAIVAGIFPTQIRHMDEISGSEIDALDGMMIREYPRGVTIS